VSPHTRGFVSLSKLLSRFAFNFNLRRYNVGFQLPTAHGAACCLAKLMIARTGMYFNWHGKIRRCNLNRRTHVESVWNQVLEPEI
jgi:hypothetical protein